MPCLRVGWGLSLEWNKAHLLNHLAEVHGYRHYLELCTFMSGGRYASPGNGAASAIKAYVDFISQRHDLAVYTVDADYGCGVIRKLADHLPRARRLPALGFSETGATSATTQWKPSRS